MTMQLISEVTVGAGGAASITFSAIPDSFTDLLLVVSARSSATGTNHNLLLNPNGSTSNASARTLLGDGANVGSGTEARIIARDIPGASVTSNTFGNASFYIANYASSASKSISSDAVMENNATTSILGIAANLWANSSAISSITLAPGVGSFVEYSSASLYGITAGSDGIVSVS